MRKISAKMPRNSDSAPVSVAPLVWLRAIYEFHNFSYRDPRGAFAAAVGLPVVSPTAVLLGVCSTLYERGRQEEAEAFLKTIHLCRVKVDPPQGAVFFRAFHQLRRYVTQPASTAYCKVRWRFMLGFQSRILHPLRMRCETAITSEPTIPCARWWEMLNTWQSLRRFCMRRSERGLSVSRVGNR
jgi:hypothetical protein